jgi:hypothetical protein
LARGDFSSAARENPARRHDFRFAVPHSPNAMIDPETPETRREQDVTILSRRPMLRSLGLAGLAVISSAPQASAFLGSSSPKVSAPSSSGAAAPTRKAAQPNLAHELPQEWLRMHARVIPEYYRYLVSLRLRNVTPHQVIKAHAKSKGGVWNTLPPRQWWNRMGYTLRVLDHVAHALGSPVTEVLSAYRSPAYNRRCAGARAGSWHQANVAIDVRFPVRASAVTATARNLRDRGLFRGGIGGYGSFTHIDTRGENINW